MRKSKLKPIIIDWDKVWLSFNRWFDYRAKDYRWETQEKQIEKIINRKIKAWNRRLK